MLSILTSVLIVVSVPVIYWIFQCLQKILYVVKCRRRTAQLPGLPTLPIIGNLHQIPLPVDERFNDFLCSLSREFPHVFHMHVTPMRATCVVNHPRNVKLLMKSSEPKDRKISGVYKLLTPWLGEGLLISDGPHWFRNRRLLTPAFHFDILKPYMMVYNECADILLEKWSPKQSGNIECRDIYGDVSLFALNVIMKCAFSCEDDVQRLGESHPYVKAVYKLTETIMANSLRPWTHIEWLYSLTSEGKEFKANCNYVHKVAEDVIKKRREEIKFDSVSNSNKGRLDFLDVLLSAKDEDGSGLTDAEIRNEVDTFLFEGHDTTASGMSWILYALASHPEYQQNAREEVDSILDGREDQNIEWDDLNKMPYLTRCIKESMRLYSPVPIVGRMLSKPMTIEGVELLPDTAIYINFYAMHHNPQVWGEDHMEYKPDRFLHENISKMDSYAFCPFAAGPRNCIGQNFAMNEMKTMTARMLHRNILEIDSTCTAPKPVPKVVQRSMNGIQMKIIPRSQERP